MGKILAMSYGLDNAVWNALQEQLQRRGTELVLLAVPEHQKTSDLTCTVVEIPFGLSGMSGRVCRKPDRKLDSTWLEVWKERERAYFNGQRSAVTDAQIYEFYQLCAEQIRAHDCFLGVSWNRIFPMSDVFRQCLIDHGQPTLDLERGLLPGTLMLNRHGIGALSDLYLSPLLQQQCQGGRHFTSQWFFNRVRGWYHRERPTKYRQPEIIAKDELRRQLRLKPEAEIIFFAGQADIDLGLYPLDTSLARQQSSLFAHTYEALSFLAELFGDRDDVQIVFKPHPGDQGFLRPERDIEGVVMTNENIHTLITASDVVVTLSSPIFVDALLYNKPVVTLAPHQLSRMGIVYEPATRSEIEDSVEMARRREDEVGRQRRFKNCLGWLASHYLFGVKAGHPVRYGLSDLAAILCAYGG